MDAISTPARAAAFVAAGAFLLGLAPIGLRLSEVGPMATAVWRFAFALPILVALAAAQPKPAAPGPRSRRGLVLAAAGVFFGLDIVLWHAALTLTTVANATLLSNLTPVIAAAVGWLVFKERIGRGFAFGAALALGGAGLLTLGRAQSGVAAGPGGALGDALGLFSAVWYAGYLILMREVRRDLDAWRAMAATTVGALGVGLVATAVLGESLFPTTWSGWAVLVGLGLVVHVGGQGLIAVGLGGLPLTISTVLLWVQPLAAAAFSWVLFGEKLGPLALLGAVLVLGGLYVVQASREKG